MGMKLGKYGIRLGRLLILAGGMLLSVSVPALAAGTVSVTADKSSASVSDTVTVTVQTSEPEDASTQPEISITYDTSVLTFEDCNVEYGGGGGGLVTVKGTSAQLTFTASASGSATVSAEAIIDEDGNNPAEGAATVEIRGSGTASGLSSDATLRALSMNPGVMTPAFSPTVTEYTITIDDSVTDITVSGGVSDENAQITAASGFKNLKSGTNEAVITVTAEDGSTLTYHFTIERGESQQEEQAEEDTAETEVQKPSVVSDGLNVKIDNVSYTVQETFANALLPDGCSKTNITFGGQQVDAAVFDAGGLVLLYAVADGEESGDFFIYDQSDGAMLLFVQLRCVENRFIVPIFAERAAPDGFVSENMQWNESYIPAYVLSDSTVENADAFYLLYAVNNDGEKGFYLYDIMEGTYQRFLDYGGQSQLSGGKTSNKLLYAVIALLILLVGAIVVIVNLLIHTKEVMEEKEIEDEPVETTGGRREQKTEQKKAAGDGDLSSRKRREKQTEDGEQKAQSGETAHGGEAAQNAQGEETAQNAQKQKGQKTKPLSEKAELKAAQKAEQKAEKEKAAKEKAERLAAQKAAKEKAARLARERKEREAAERETAESEAKTQASQNTAKEKRVIKPSEETASDSTKVKKVIKPSESGTQKKAVREQNAEEKQAAQKAVKDTAGEAAEARTENRAVKGEAKKITGWTANISQVPNEAQNATQASGSAQNASQTPRSAQATRTPQRGFVPIYTLERQPVPLTREAPPDQLDDDFEFEFINIDND